MDVMEENKTNFICFKRALGRITLAFSLAREFSF